MKTQKWDFQKFLKRLVSIYIWIFSILLALLLLLTIPFLISVIFDFINGEKVLDDTIEKATENITNQDEKALAIMSWEHNYFQNPYSLHDQNSTLQKYNVFKINDDYKIFVRGAPVSWIIHSRLANCEEYTKVFVILMNKAGIKSNIIYARGEDHVWAEYNYNAYRIAVDPSQNFVIGSRKKEFEKIMNVNFSYVETLDEFGNKKDVSDEYINRGNLTIHVFDNKQFVQDAKVIIKNPYLMKNRGSRYDKPLDVISNLTDHNGEVFFELGFQEYVVEVRVKNLFLYDTIYQKNVTVEIDKENLLNFNIDIDNKKNSLF